MSDTSSEPDEAATAAVEEATPEPEEATAEPEEATAEPAPEVPEPAAAEPEPEAGAAAEAATPEPEARGKEPALEEPQPDRPEPAFGSGSPAFGSGSGPPEPEAEPAPGRRIPVTRVVVALLLALLGFSFAVQVRSVSTDPALAALGQEDLVRILANLDDHEERLRDEIAELEATQRRLTNTGESQQEALAEVTRRADELGILAGTLPAHGPGLIVQLRGGPEAVTAARLLGAVQELRGAGAEAMQIRDGKGALVRVVASTYFVNDTLDDGTPVILMDGQALVSPYTIAVIGDPQTLAPALHIPGGVVETVEGGGGTVQLNESDDVNVTALRASTGLQHARPVS